MQRLDGRTALVTGGNKGVGRGIVYKLVEQGAKVCIVYNSSQDFADETLQKANEISPDSAIMFKADVSKRENVKAAVGALTARYGRLDILVNNAALQPNKVISEYDLDTFRMVWDINIGGYFLALQECLPYLKQSPCPRVINVSSVHGIRPSLFDAGYSMTKSAIKMFTREAAIELARYKITVNSITLGACRIEGKTGNFRFRAGWPEPVRQRSSYPLGITHPRDVGSLAAYLAGDESGMITGSAIRLDGASTLL